MAVIARIVGLSLLMGTVAAGLGPSFLGHGSDTSFISFVLGCVGALVGAIAGAAREVAAGRSSS